MIMIMIMIMVMVMIVMRMRVSFALALPAGVAFGACNCAFGPAKTRPKSAQNLSRYVR